MDETSSRSCGPTGEGGKKCECHHLAGGPAAAVALNKMGKPSLPPSLSLSILALRPLEIELEGAVDSGATFHWQCHPKTPTRMRAYDRHWMDGGGLLIFDTYTPIYIHVIFRDDVNEYARALLLCWWACPSLPSPCSFSL